MFDYRDIERDSICWGATNSGPVRTTEYDLFIDRVTAALVGVSAWLEKRGFVNPLMPATLAGAGAGVLLALVRRPCPMTISVLADLSLVVPAIVEIFA